MAITVNLFLDSTEFSGATAVYADIELTTKAPDGYYTYNRINRRQLSGLLQTGIHCSASTIGDCTILPVSYQYLVNYTESNGSSTQPPACSGNTVYPIWTNVSNITNITSGTTLYSDVNLTIPWIGESEWYGIGTTYGGSPTSSYQINNSGDVISVNICTLSTTCYNIQGVWTNPDPAHPNGGFINYYDEFGILQSIIGIWDTDTYIINASSIDTHSGVAISACVTYSISWFQGVNTLGENSTFDIFVDGVNVVHSIINYNIIGDVNSANGVINVIEGQLVEIYQEGTGYAVADNMSLQATYAPGIISTDYSTNPYTTLSFAMPNVDFQVWADVGTQP